MWSYKAGTTVTHSPPPTHVIMRPLVCVVHSLLSLSECSTCLSQSLDHNLNLLAVTGDKYLHKAILIQVSDVSFSDIDICLFGYLYVWIHICILHRRQMQTVDAVTPGQYTGDWVVAYDFLSAGCKYIRICDVADS